MTDKGLCVCVCVCVCVCESLLYMTLCDPIDYSLPWSSVRGILQARILERVAIHISRGSSQSRDQTQVSCTAGRFFTILATRLLSSIYKQLIQLNIEKRNNQIKKWNEEHFPKVTEITNRHVKRCHSLGTCKSRLQ